MADLAKLVVRLEAESAKLHRDLDRSNKKLSKFERNAKRAGKALKAFGKIGVAGLASTSVVLGVMARKTLDLADRIGKLSQTTGLSSEQLSRLRYQAELSGSNFAVLTKGVVKFQRAMYDANNGLATQADAFGELGIAVANNDGTLRKTEDVMGDLAESFKGMEDGAKKSAIAQVLIGRAGAEMIPFLNAGRDGLKEMADEADALGITMDGKLTSAAERTNDNLSRIKTALEGVFLRVMAQAMPRIEEFTKALVRWVKDGDKVAETVTFIGNAMKTVATVATIVGGLLEIVGRGIGAMAAAASFAIEGDFSKALQVMQDGTRSSVYSVLETVEKVKQTWIKFPAEIAAQADDAGKKIASPVVAAEKIVEMAVKDIEKGIKKAQKALEAGAKAAADISKKFEARHQAVIAPEFDIEKANTIDVGFLELQAKQAIKAGDIDGAIAKLDSAFDILDHMKEAGTQSSLVLEGLSTSLRNVGEEISDEKMAQIEAKVGVDIEAYKEAVLSGSDEMQALLDANPLVQNIVINSDLIPNSASQSVSNQNSLTPVQLTLPSGETRLVYGDAAGVDQWQRDLAIEATKRGTR